MKYMLLISGNDADAGARVVHSPIERRFLEERLEELSA